MVNQWNSIPKIRYTPLTISQVKLVTLVEGDPKAPFSIATVFVPRPTERESVAQGLFWWVRAQGRSPHAPGISQKLSIATTPSCTGGRNSIPWITPLYPWSLPYNAEC